MGNALQMTEGGTLTKVAHGVAGLLGAVSAALVVGVGVVILWRGAGDAPVRDALWNLLLGSPSPQDGLLYLALVGVLTAGLGWAIANRRHEGRRELVATGWSCIGGIGLAAIGFLVLPSALGGLHHLLFGVSVLLYVATGSAALGRWRLDGSAEGHARARE